MRKQRLARVDAELFVFTHIRVNRGFMNKHCMARDAAEFVVFVCNSTSHSSLDEQTLPGTS